MLKRMVIPNARRFDALLTLAAAVLLCQSLGFWRFGRLGRFVLVLVAGKAIEMASRTQRFPKPNIIRE